MERTTDIVSSLSAVEIEDLMGIQFVWCGRNPEVGLDCIGLVRYIRELHGLSLEKFPEFLSITQQTTEQDFDSTFIRQWLDQYCKREAVPQNLDLCLFKGRGQCVLGTVLQLEVLSIAYMSPEQGSIIVPMPRLINYLHGLWRYEAEKK